MKLNYETVHAISMLQFGINTVVSAFHGHMMKIADAFETKPDELIGQGLGKKNMHRVLKKHLLAEDRWFEKNIDKAVKGNPRWNKFLDDCINFAVLDWVVTGNQIQLLRPRSFDRITPKNNFQSTRRPTYVGNLSELY